MPSDGAVIPATKQMVKRINELLRQEFGDNQPAICLVHTSVTRVMDSNKEAVTVHKGLL